jgi:hypothetical protein
MTHDPTRDCEHGRLKGKCDVCDLQAEVLEQCRIIAMGAEREDALRAELTRLKASIALDKMADNARELGLDYEPALMQQPATLDEMHAIGNGIMYGEQPAPVQERNFCERCGKRLGGDGHIHTCTPPAAQKTWVGLTDAEIEACDCLHVLWTGDDDQELVGTKDFARAIEAKLKEKNT